MTLTVCPECGGQVSDQAATCPHCGAPVRAAPRAPAAGRPAKRTNWGALVVLCLALGAIAAIVIWARSLQDAPSSYTAQGSFTATDSRCQPASAAQMANIRAGVEGVQASNTVKQGFAVKSSDHVNVYLVAAKIYGPSMENGAGPGVWAISGDPSAPGLTLAVDGYAQNFTDFPDASKTQAAITLATDGVQAARDCAAKP